MSDRALAVAVCVALVLAGGDVGAQPQPSPAAPAIAAPPPEARTPIPSGAPGARKLSFEEVIRRAMTRSPDTALAASEAKRAQAIVEQVRSGWLPTVAANATYTRLDGDRVLQDRVILGANQLSANLLLTVPILAPRALAATARARESAGIAGGTLVDTRRQVALVAGRAYLSVIAQHRVLETAARALDVARAHEEFARSRLRGGVGNRLDAVRATQERATAQARLEQQGTALARAQEALGIAVGEDVPLDAQDVSLAAPPPLPDALREASGRSDVTVQRDQVETTRKAVRDDYVDYLPALVAVAQPFYQNPPTLTQPLRGWQAQLVLSIPLFDGGTRYGLADERAALHAQAKTRLDATLRQARSDVRIAFEAVQRADAALAAAREAAVVAREALSLAELAYRAGATSNIELVDAQRRERDADTDAAIAEDAARQARLDLLAACGRFP